MKGHGVPFWGHVVVRVGAPSKNPCPDSFIWVR